MKKISFTKMSGAGNDFILFDRNSNPSIEMFPEAVSKMCERRTGIGADGILVIGDHPDYDFTMEYYNADGSTGTLCGNGARCALRYAQLSHRLNGKQARFLSNNSIYSGEILDDDRVKFNLGVPVNFMLNFKLNVEGQQINSSFVNTGSPHVVIKIQDILKNVEQPDSFFNDISEVPVFDLGRKIRYLPKFAPGGTNVNFISIKNDEIFIRTYERGVEDETLACGTGSVASALISYFNDGIKPPVTLITKNGNKLIVDFLVDGQNLKNVSLSGPAEVTFSGEFLSNLYF